MSSAGVVGSAAEIAQALYSANAIAAASHYSPDADAYGSLLGIAGILRNLGKKVVTLNQDGILPRFSFLPGIQEVTRELPEIVFDTFIACDCGDERRLGEALKGPLLAIPQTLNVDHHVSNNCFAKKNYVVGEASSTCELVFRIGRELEKISNKVLIDKNVALCLFAGISADTGSFRYASTAASTFEVARALLELGAKPALVSEALYERNSLAATKLQAEALTGLALFAKGKISKVVVPAVMYSKYDATPEDTEELVERARAIDGVRVAVLIREEQGLWKVSLRAKGDSCDVSKVALQFGGGGHRAAAGFRWRGTFEELDSKLMPILEQAVK